VRFIKTVAGTYANRLPLRCDPIHFGEREMVSADFRRQLEGYGLTTANILYRMPDHPKILQTFIWQDYDLHPDFPQLRKFLDFWSTKLEGKLHSVTVAHQGLIKPAEWRHVGHEFRLH
jgi:uncharacterized protein Usg